MPLFILDYYNSRVFIQSNILDYYRSKVLDYYSQVSRQLEHIFQIIPTMKFSGLLEDLSRLLQAPIITRNQMGWGTYCCMSPKMMGATCTNRLRSLLTMYHVLKFLKQDLKFHCNFWKVSITITLLFFSEYQIETLNQKIFLLFF